MDLRKIDSSGIKYFKITSSASQSQQPTISIGSRSGSSQSLDLSSSGSQLGCSSGEINSSSVIDISTSNGGSDEGKRRSIDSVSVDGTISKRERSSSNSSVVRGDTSASSEGEGRCELVVGSSDITSSSNSVRI